MIKLIVGALLGAGLALIFEMFLGGLGAFMWIVFIVIGAITVYEGPQDGRDTLNWMRMNSSDPAMRDRAIYDELKRNREGK